MAVESKDKASARMSTAETTLEEFADTRPGCADALADCAPIPGSTLGADALADCAPIPGSALGPALNEQGYYVGRVEGNL
jgi:hypothetical protein